MLGVGGLEGWGGGVRVRGVGGWRGREKEGINFKAIQYTSLDIIIMTCENTILTLDPKLCPASCANVNALMEEGILCP